MFRLITIWCLIHVCGKSFLKFYAMIIFVTRLVGNIIRGRILLDGDANRHDSIPTNSRLLIRLEQISEADTSEVLFEEIEIPTLDTFPIEYQIKIPSASSYRLAAQVKRGPIFLYVGEQTISTTDLTPSITVDVSVRAVRGREYFDFQ